MKTTDLIPLILFELEVSDKYGFELTKNIETKSNGKIVIKQPTLYTLLKKLEKSKFISSYWQDSEIGGKRHYYKLTENGKLQLSTLPSYETLIKLATDEEVSEEEMRNNSVAVFSVSPEEKPISIMDELLNQNIAASETIIPSSEVFKEENIDSATELAINLSNTDILKEEQLTQEEIFAENKQVTSFTEKLPTNPVTAPVVEEKKWSNITNLDYNPPKVEIDVKYVDYVDFKNSAENKYAKKVVKAGLINVIATSLTLLMVLFLSQIFVLKTSASALYYLFFISAILFIVFYPTIYAIKMSKLRLKYQSTTYQPKLKQRLIIGAAITLAVAIVSIIVSLKVGKSSVAQILSVKNFANFYAPILIVLVYFIDILYSFLLTKKINK